MEVEVHGHPEGGLAQAFVLLSKQTQITVERAKDGPKRAGLTFELVRRGRERLLHIHAPTLGCGFNDDVTSSTFDAP